MITKATDDKTVSLNCSNCRKNIVLITLLEQLLEKKSENTILIALK